jgi:hypothetical protein
VGLAGLITACSAIAACDPPGDDDDADTGCATVVADAADSIEPAEQLDLLDTALLTCRSFTEFRAEMGRHPGIIGYDTATFVELRCTRIDDEATRTSPTCTAIVVPTTTAPSTTVPSIVFVGDTLDGRQIEITPADGVEFVGDVPTVVQQTVDIAFESGCEGVIAQRDLWISRIDDTPAGDIASLYAQHAQNVANFIGCPAN